MVGVVGAGSNGVFRHDPDQTCGMHRNRAKLAEGKNGKDLQTICDDGGRRGGGDMVERRRGAQTGNNNALKHGFYSRKFKAGEIDDLDVLESNDKLQDEILLLKVVIRRVWEMASTSAVDLDSWAMALGVLGMAMTRQAGLLRVQSILGFGNSEITNAISQAIREVTDEFDRK